ncbi:adenine nucleotide transporter BT1, chloroplastic/mitochondrial-like [Phragmites australis]|uniref:adenine nucleotide transporter BT1, chloroplastic/mitochondrial-like n=1 Tax=Phragmites australis TaxID=29695 RepID=UPI002D796DEC|nr:adenine nucleotide transporter BT1, chloroplastic/mitochondrial-like [Phragmites australis]
MSRKSGGARMQCAEAAAAADWACCFLALPPAAPYGVDGDARFNLSWTLHQSFHPPTGLFASMGQQVGVGFPGSSSSPPSPDTPRDPYMKYVSPEVGHRVVETPLPGEGEELREKGNKKVVKLKIKVGNRHLKRLISGAIAGAVSRTTVAPLETIRTHLMVGSNGNSTTEVFQSIMKHEGWTGLFRGNFVNVIRVAPSKAIELFAFDTANKFLTPKSGEEQKVPIPPSLVAGAFAGVSSTLCTYPLELIKTRLTIQRGVYDNFLDALVKIVREEGATELYRGLTPSLIGVVPYAATNYFAYDTLKKVYKKMFKTNKVGNVPTLLIGSAAGAISSTATFPLEVARKHMQVGAVGGRRVYKNMLHALLSILEDEGVGGLYRGLGPSCMKLVPAAGISFMCYEACKKILIEEEDE